jgi:hypothetical protein
VKVPQLLALVRVEKQPELVTVIDVFFDLRAEAHASETVREVRNPTIIER